MRKRERWIVLGVVVFAIAGFALIPAPPDEFEPLRKLGPTAERTALYHYAQARNPAGNLLPRRVFIDHSFAFPKMTPEIRAAVTALTKSGKVKLTSTLPEKAALEPEVQLRFHHQPKPSWMEQQWTTARNFLNF